MDTHNSCINFLTKENITLAIAIIGLVISTINFIYFFAVRKKKLMINFGDIGIKNYIRNSNILLTHYRFDNCSQLSISITRIQLIINNIRYDCDIRKHIAEKMEYSKNKDVYHKIISETDVLPINLLPLASQSGFLGFVIPPNSLSKDEKALTFRICTNRGKAIQKTFVLHEDKICH